MISIIMGTYNRFAKLKNAVVSIIKAGKALDYSPEIIVIDGGSTDATLGFLDNHPSIKVIKENGLHGVTRAYNRGFRLASEKYITWFADDFVYLPDTLKIAVNRLKKENNRTLISFSIDVKDGAGFRNYGNNTPIGAGHRDLFKAVDFWSEDFITYASDNDFSMKIHMIGGKVVPEPRAKIVHNINIKDNLHQENLKNNRCSLRYRNLYHRGVSGFTQGYAEVFIKAKNAQELMLKLEKARQEIGWCNYYTDNAFGLISQLKSMNVFIRPFQNAAHYSKVI